METTKELREAVRKYDREKVLALLKKKALKQIENEDEKQKTGGHPVPKCIHDGFWNMSEKVWTFWYTFTEGGWRIWLYTDIIEPVHGISILTGGFMRFKYFARSTTWSWRIFSQTSRQAKILTGQDIRFLWKMFYGRGSFSCDRTGSVRQE